MTTEDPRQPAGFDSYDLSESERMVLLQQQGGIVRLKAEIEDRKTALAAADAEFNGMIKALVAQRGETSGAWQLSADSSQIVRRG